MPELRLTPVLLFQYAWVMPNSSARCAQLPRAVDKVPFYAALKKFRDYLRGDLPDLDEAEVVFPEVKLQNFNNKRIKAGLEKNRFFLNPAQWFFLGFLGFFIYICLEEGFWGFFSLKNTFRCIQTLNNNHSY
jgi:hypothetical protein